MKKSSRFNRNRHCCVRTKRFAVTKSLLQWEKVPRNEADEVFLGKTTIFDTSSPHLGAMSSPTGEGLVHGKPLINTTKCNDQKFIVNALSVSLTAATFSHWRRLFVPANRSFIHGREVCKTGCRVRQPLPIAKNRLFARAPSTTKWWMRF